MNLKRLWNCYTSIPLPIWVCCLRRLVNHISRQLSFPSHPNMKWSLQIHPNGVNEEVQDYSSLFLNRADIGEEEPNVVAVSRYWEKSRFIHDWANQHSSTTIFHLPLVFPVVCIWISSRMRNQRRPAASRLFDILFVKFKGLGSPTLQSI